MEHGFLETSRYSTTNIQKPNSQHVGRAQATRARKRLRLKAIIPGPVSRISFDLVTCPSPPLSLPLPLSLSLAFALSFAFTLALPFALSGNQFGFFLVVSLEYACVSSRNSNGLGCGED